MLNLNIDFLLTLNQTMIQHCYILIIEFKKKV